MMRGILIIKNGRDFYEKYYPFIVTAVFLALSIILMYHHEFWRDEIQSWLIGSESSSISEFINNMRDNQGHPFLWNAILYFTSHFITENVESIKIIHLAISTALVYLFLKYSPFNKTIKTMFVFGYFTFYEYSIISRNYALGLLLMVVFCILYKNKYKNIIPISIVLFFMGLLNIYSFLLSVVLFLMLLVEFVIDRNVIKKNIYRIYIVIAIIVILAEILFVYWQMYSQTIDNSWNLTISSLFNKSIDEYKASLTNVSYGIIKTYIPIPQVIIKFWESSIIIYFLSRYSFLYIFLFSLILLIIPLFFIKRRTILLYILGVTSILFIPFFIYIGSNRHFGHLFMLIIISLWLSQINKGDKYLIKSRKNFIKKSQNIFLIIILSFSLIGSSIAFYFDYKYPFSNGKYVADYIEENFNKDNLVIVGYVDNTTQTIAGYLDKDIYYPNSKDFKKLVSWNKRRPLSSIEEVFQDANHLASEGKEVLIVLSLNISDNSMPEKYLFKKIDIEFTNSVVIDENYYLYLLER